MRDRNPDDAFTILLDPSRTVDEFGWKPKTPLEEGVAAAIQYYRDHGIDRDVHAPQARAGEAAGPVSELGGTSALVVGGAGFVGGNLVRELLARGAARVLVVDNLLSAERENVPDDPRVAFVEGSIADDAVLAQLDDEFDYVFHLATYHGNQSSIANPLADHEHNLITTLKLFERIKDFERLRKVVYAASGCTLAPHTYGEAEAVDGGRAGAARPRQPVPDLQGRRASSTPSTTTGGTACRRCARASRTSTAQARSSARAGGEERRRRCGGTSTPTFVYRALKGMPLELDNEGRASRDFIYVGRHRRRPPALRDRRRAGRRLQPGERRRDVDPRTRGDGSTSSDRERRRPSSLRPARDWDRSGHRFGSTEKARRRSGFEARMPLDDGLARTIDWTHEHLDLIDACVERHAEHVAVPT